jgi:flagellar protein FliS
MTLANQYTRYMNQTVAASTPGEQIVMLFEHASFKLTKAIQCIEAKDIPGAHNAIVRVQNIYQFLSDCLDMRYEISGNLFALYQFAYDELTTANMKKDTEILRRILKMTKEFEETWRKADLKTRLERAAR